MRPISCAEAQQEIARRVFEAVEPHVEATLSAHLAVCDRCRVHADDVTRAAQLLGASLLLADPPEDLERRVITAIRAQPKAEARSRRRLLTGAVAAALMVFGLALLWTTEPEVARGAAVLAAAPRFETASGEASIVAGTLRVKVAGLPALLPDSTYAVWVGDSREGWALLGQFRSSGAEVLYPLGPERPEQVRVTIERIGGEPEVPNVVVLTGRW